MEVRKEVKIVDGKKVAPLFEVLVRLLNQLICVNEEAV